MSDDNDQKPELSRGEKIRRLHQDPEWHAAWLAKVRAGRQRQTPEERSEGAKKSHTPESDAKRSESMTRTWSDPLYRGWLSESLGQASQRPEVKAKRSKSAREARQRPEVKAKHDAANADPEVRAMKAAGSRKRWSRPGEHERQSEAIRQSWEVPEAHVNSMRHRQSMPLTGLEIKVLAALAERGINLPPENIHMPADRYEFDFYVEHLKLDIECDSRFWHAHPDRAAHDNRRDGKLKAAGYKVLRLTEAEIVKNDWSRLDEALEDPRSAGG